MKKSIALISIALATALHAQTIQKIEFTNLTRISNEIATETAKISQGENLDPAKVNEAVKKFYKFGYFDDIQATINDGVLQFIFKEKPAIANVDMEGYKTREEDIQDVVKRIGLSKGTMYTKSRVEQAREALLKELQREGLVNSVVEIEMEQINQDSVALTILVNKGEEIIIKEATYHGATSLDIDDFEDVTANKEEDYFSWFFGQNDGEVQIEELPYENLRINELYYEHGYLDSVVKPPFLKVDFASNEAKLDFFINEGPQYTANDIKIFVDTSIIDPEKLYKELKTQKDEQFNLKYVRADSEYIKTQIADLGYAFAQVKFDIKKDANTGKADVVFSVIPGEKVYINDVFISGNSKTLDRVIRRDIYLAHGDLFSLTDYKDSILKLKRSGFFEDVIIDQKRISEDKMDLIVKVKEMSTGSLVLGGGYGSFDGFIVNASIQDRNIFGSGLSLGFSIDNSDQQDSYSLSLSNPSIRDSEYNGKIQIYSKSLDIEYDNDFGEYDLDKKSTGFVVGAGKEFARNLYIGVDYKLENVEEDYNYLDEASYRANGGNIRPNEEYLISSLTTYLNFNNTNDYYFPTAGFNVGTSVEFAGLGGDAEFIENTTYFKYYYSLEDIVSFDAVFRYRGQVQAIIDNGFVPYGSSLYLGGPKSLRGFESYAFGPDFDIAGQDEPMKYSFTNGFELNFPLVPSAKMRWGLFYDYGMIGQDSFSDIKRSSTGALIEWISPVGPLQLIFAQPLDDEPGDDTSTFEFSLGTSF